MSGINLAVMSDQDLVTLVQNNLNLFEQQKEQYKTTLAPVYNGISLRDLQQYEKQLQRAIFAQAPGATETRERVTAVLKANGIDNSGTDFKSKNIDMNAYYDRVNRRQF